MSFQMKLAVGAVISLGCIIIVTQSTAVRRLFYALNYDRTLDAYSQVDTTVSDVTNAIGPDGRPASLVSAFFGLDDALPLIADRLICEGAAGKDGMPVVFSHEVDIRTLEPGDFKVTTSTGAIGKTTCLSLAPADDPGELRTVLLVGQFGSSNDQPAKVEIVGNLLSIDDTVNFKGMSVKVTPLEDGPSLVLAERIPREEWTLNARGTSLQFGGGSGCPINTKQVIRVTWNGGITKPNGHDVDDLERRLYSVTVQQHDNSLKEITPFALGDLHDGDNNHKLCLDTTALVKSVSFPAGHLTDPRGDLNPSTSIAVLN